MGEPEVNPTFIPSVIHVYLRNSVRARQEVGSVICVPPPGATGNQTCPDRGTKTCPGLVPFTGLPFCAPIGACLCAPGACFSAPGSCLCAPRHVLVPRSGNLFVPPGHVLVPRSSHLFVTPGHVFVPRLGHQKVPRSGQFFVTPGHVFVPRVGHKKVTRWGH